MGRELRQTNRYNMSLPVRIVAADGQELDWIGHTIDIGAGGVRFMVPGELPVGKTVEYIITLSEYNPVSLIRCTGSILRSVKKDEAGHLCFETAATMERYAFVQPEGKDLAAAPGGKASSAA